MPRIPRTAPVSLTRRRLIGALGTSALGPSLGGCAAPPPPPPLRPVDAAKAPRVGDLWRYEFRSVFRVPSARLLEVRVLEVGAESLRDRVATVNEPEADEHAFDSSLEMVERPLAVDRSRIQRFLRRLTVFEFSPYLQAFGPLPDEGSVAAPTPAFGDPFTGRARLRGAERITLPAGSFDAVRMDYEISRPFVVTMRPEIDPVFILATVWYVAAVKRPVRWTVVARAGDRNILVDDTYELSSYRPA